MQASYTQSFIMQGWGGGRGEGGRGRGKGEGGRGEGGGKRGGRALCILYTLLEGANPSLLKTRACTLNPKRNCMTYSYNIIIVQVTTTCGGAEKESWED
jgi:hypothetical protein